MLMYAGVCRCSDAELHAILSRIRPFLRPSGAGWLGEMEGGGSGGSALLAEEVSKRFFCFKIQPGPKISMPGTKISVGIGGVGGSGHAGSRDT